MESSEPKPTTLQPQKGPTHHQWAGTLPPVCTTAAEGALVLLTEGVWGAGGTQGQRLHPTAAERMMVMVAMVVMVFFILLFWLWFMTGALKHKEPLSIYYTLISLNLG